MQKHQYSHFALVLQSLSMGNYFSTDAESGRFIQLNNENHFPQNYA